jgi:LmbE family N-acetylglucosaminyl deacetylase
MEKIIRQVLVHFYVKLIKLCIREVEPQLDSIVIIAPHPDDEIIGLGGFIIQMLRKNKKVHFIFLTDGEESNSFSDKEIIKKERIKLTSEVMNKLHVSDEFVHRLHLPDGAVPRKGNPGFENSVQELLKLVENIKPDAIFSTHYLEHWPFDHLACFELACELTRRITTKTELWLYWVWTWHNLRPWKLLNVFRVKRININDSLAEKKKLVDIYITRKSPKGVPWSGNLPPLMLMPFSNPMEIVEKYDPF